MIINIKNIYFTVVFYLTVIVILRIFSTECVLLIFYSKSTVKVSSVQ